MTFLRRVFLTTCLLLVLVCPAIAQGEPVDLELNRTASRIVKEFETTYGAQVGVSCQVLKTGKVPFSYNGTKPMIPASNLKVVTTAVALDTLGPDYRFETRLYGSSRVKDGVLEGNLVLKGSGDPSFFAPFVDSPTGPFKSMIRTLNRQGIKKVTGELIVDDSDFDRQFIPPSYHERYLLDSYAAPVGGLSLNRNVVTVSVSSKGLSVSPDSGSMKLVNDVKVGGGDEIWAERSRGSDTVVVHGVASMADPVLTTLTVNDPVRFAGSAFFRLLAASGVEVKGKWRTVAEGVGADLSGLQLLARHSSPTLKQLLEKTNVQSDNILAQHIFKRMGATVVGYGTARNSEAVVRDFLKRHNVSDIGLKMVDGSGLSEKDRIAPYQLVYILKAMWSHKDGQVFIDTLPGPGEGTMRSRLDGALVRAKTGTLNNHSGLTGYVVTAYGETVGFSILINGIDATWSAVELQDRLVRLLSQQSRPL